MGYQTGAFAQQAIKELQGIGDNPLFLALGFRKPHLPFNAPKKYWDLYDPAEIKLAPLNAPPEYSAVEGHSNWGELRNYHGIPDEGPISEETSRKLIHGYYACVSYVDAQIGLVLAELDRLGLRENTVVVLWADHGWKLGDYGMWCKHTNYEIDTRVPLMVRVPGMKEAGRKTDALVELVDLYPTLCELARIDKPAHLEGHSFVPLLNDSQQPWKKAAFSIWAERSADEKNGFIGYSMRHGKYRYTEWRNTHTDALVSRELYDHGEGSLAAINLVDHPEYKNMVQKMGKILKAGPEGALPDR
jgi:iduronate 2-sulfatase